MSPDVKHDHLVVNCRATKPPMTKQELHDWMVELVRVIDMKIVIPVGAAYVDIPGNRGATALVGVEFSHCALHVWDEEVPGHLRLDVYSCKTFDIEKVFEHLNKFEISDVEYQFMDRTTGIWIKRAEKRN